MPALSEVGFWTSRPEPADGPGSADGRANPLGHVQPSTQGKCWGETAEAQALTAYLRAGYVETYEMGYSFCRFGEVGLAADRGSGPCPAGAWRDMGCVALTDGEFVWPEGLVHYVEVHSVRPPGVAGAALLAKAMRPDGLRFVAARQAAFRVDQRGDMPAAPAALLSWEAGFIRPLPTAMAALVAEQSPVVSANLGAQAVPGARSGGACWIPRVTMTAAAATVGIAAMIIGA